MTVDGRIPESQRLALAPTVKHQLTLIGASFKPLFVMQQLRLFQGQIVKSKVLS